MKKLLFASMLAACLCLASTIPAFAVGPLALDGNDYKVYIFCADDVGDYCSQGKVADDTFKFEDDSFTLESFDDDDWLGMGDAGEYSESGISFDAEYEIFNEDAEKYTFDIKGINLVDTIIAGTMEISYSNENIFESEEDEDGSAYFIGIKN